MSILNIQKHIWINFSHLLIKRSTLWGSMTRTQFHGVEGRGGVATYFLT